MSKAIEDLLFDVRAGNEWHMQFSERCALLYILDRIKPDISIEIGTFQCGSLAAIAAASQNVYTFDIDTIDHGSRFPNTRFITGDSAETLPKIIDDANNSSREINFILVDGSHSEEGVLRDLIECLRYRPKTRPTVVVMHDSANPAVRRGIEHAPWNESPYVHMLDLDFVPGMLYDRSDIMGQMWGGLAVAVMLPTPRDGHVAIHSTFAHSFAVLAEKSIYATAL
ncbi:class I SAM-dependent methyltransferase [Sphingomonas qilianensis]|uniref:Class I SAM-dependent methyltransferase n=1 Tax=Sphingomonas qilianensis TaxID=1736690 RepID=A0ABU9XTF9_9SPHN